jgi:TolA-binding protein
MKNRGKKWLAAAIALLLMVSVGVTALAAESGTTREEKLQERQQRIDEAQAKVAAREAAIESKMGEFSEFRQQVEALRLVILDNREENIALVSENNQLRLATVQALKALKDSGAMLPEETVTELKTLNEQAKAVAEQLIATRGDIKDVAQANRGNYRAKDYEAMVAAFEQIGEIQNTRYGLLLQMKDILTEMNALVAQAGGAA